MLSDWITTPLLEKLEKCRKIWPMPLKPTPTGRNSWHQATLQEAKCFYHVPWHSVKRTIPWASMGMLFLCKKDVGWLKSGQSYYVTHLTNTGIKKYPSQQTFYDRNVNFLKRRTGWLQGLFATLCINSSQHNDTLLSATILKVAFHLLFCCVSWHDHSWS
jgi:hypothetical protein